MYSQESAIDRLFGKYWCIGCGNCPEYSGQRVCLSLEFLPGRKAAAPCLLKRAVFLVYGGKELIRTVFSPDLSVKSRGEQR